ncbi:hypothetical protein MVEN_01673400 [Mycena venus]|uniref:GATA-type domain-containing protein n=1 Tax=Mycena venus TaxID=2733690 RepID=A0A8H6XRD8_9AGAR|nr:hypothetical protein MVEN_01673400 [Mycena venus]
MSQPWGLHYSLENRTISLPLVHVHVAANIKELAAEVKLTHTYSNETEVPLEATYSFPNPARASVCSFVMIKQDGTRVVGHVQEKGEAREIYETVILEENQAALMEQQTPDVFQLAVGNVHPHEKIKIELVYATELTEDEGNDSIRFHLPLQVGSRYGQAPWSLSPQNDLSWYLTAPFPRHSPFLEIFVTVEAVAPIAGISCPSHIISTEFGPDPALPTAREIPFSNYARVSLASEAPLDRDFSSIPIYPTTALKLTLVPRFKLPNLARQEFVFLVDRSGSMKGPRIAAAKNALVVMLRSLPAKGTLFQIASFGTPCTTLWDDGSRPYNQATLEDATQHVDGMNADYGGTEIRSALQRCFETRKTDRPTSVFVLTDGAAWDVDGVLTEVKGAVARAPAQAYLRVFVLGIGNSASTAMCEGIARVGNGTCTMVRDHETSFTGKIARLLKAACTPVITNIAVDWGVATEVSATDGEDDAFVVVSEDEGNGNVTRLLKGKAKDKTIINIFDEAVDPLHIDTYPIPPPSEVVLPSFPQVEQSPFKIQTLSPGNRLNVYAILQGRVLPKTMALTGLTEDGSEFRLSVPVTLSNLPNTPDSPPAIHALAARKIIQDLEDGRHALTISNPDDTDLLARTVKASIERLAKTHSVSSSQTSFVAVHESSAWRSDSALPARAAKRRGAGVNNRPAQPDSPINRPTSQWLPSTPPSSSYLPVTFTHDTSDCKGPTQYLRRQCFNCLTTEPPSWRRSTLNPGKIVCNKCGLYERTHLRPRPLRFDELRSRKVSKRISERPDTIPVADPDPLEALARLQSFNGCFAAGVLSVVQLNVDVNHARAAPLGRLGDLCNRHWDGFPVDQAWTYH